jgi:hypothetical protein
MIRAPPLMHITHLLFVATRKSDVASNMFRRAKQSALPDDMGLAVFDLTDNYEFPVTFALVPRGAVSSCARQRESVMSDINSARELSRDGSNEYSKTSIEKRRRSPRGGLRTDNRAS